MKAHDWEANNMSATPDSPDGPGNPGGYDAVNVYGDEYYATSNYNAVPKLRPGVMTYYRTGYAESDLVDYNTENFKSSVGLHYKTKSKNEIILNSAFGAGTTVYQGDNRFSLKDILFFQHRLEYRKENKFLSEHIRRMKMPEIPMMHISPDYFCNKHRNLIMYGVLTM
jgi:iron complex outermembrane receptor protein